MADYYATLEVKPDASQREIHKAYRRLALACHPDRYHAPDAAARFQAITEAYDVLGTSERRRAYDELRRLHDRPDAYRPQPAPRAGHQALTWVEEFFIQAGGIEAEGPGKGSLKRYSASELEEIWTVLAGRIAATGEVRVGLRNFELVLHYVHRHPEIAMPPNGAERLAEKHRVLLDLEAFRRGSHLAWTGLPPALEDLLRGRRFEDARSILLWRAVHRAAEQLREAPLFAASPTVGVPARELSMVDRLEAIVHGDPPARRLGHGYVACAACCGWAMRWGVGAPRCAYCGSRRLGLRSRDERDDWLAALINRTAPAFWNQENTRRAAAQQGRERWFWFPVFGITALGVSLVAWFTPQAWAWAALAWAWTAYGARSWRAPDIVPADTDVPYPDEWDLVRKVAAPAARAAILATLAATFAAFMQQ